jgi:hypothetical protein
MATDSLPALVARVGYQENSVRKWLQRNLDKLPQDARKPWVVDATKTMPLSEAGKIGAAAASIAMRRNKLNQYVAAIAQCDSGESLVAYLGYSKTGVRRWIQARGHELPDHAKPAWVLRIMEKMPPHVFGALGGKAGTGAAKARIGNKNGASNGGRGRLPPLKQPRGAAHQQAVIDGKGNAPKVSLSIPPWERV